ncbi:MAG: SPOR domain-containing protein [Rhodospirillaceae bacterium]|nr:SPOR domain-containing protein [Rhodospirillaceae bacterium]
MVPARHLFKAGRDVAATVAVAVCLTACTGMNVPFYGKIGEKKPATAAPVETADASAAPHAAPVAVSPLDPLNIAPPAAAPQAQSDALLVPAPGTATDASQRVPLGTFGAPAPVSGAPMSITQPPAKQQAAAPAPPAESKLEQPALIQPRAATTPIASPPPAAAPAQAAAAPVAKPKTPVLQLTPSKAVPAPLPEAARSARTEEPQETVIISSTTTAKAPVVENREFVPASVVPGQPVAPQRGLGDIPMTAGEKTVVQRFETLRRLQDENLITQDEYSRRRAANIGALLAYTKDPGAVGLERSVPGADAITARLIALRRSFEMRAITATQHALERSMILNALLPEKPDDRTDRRPPPEDVIEGAAMVGRLEALREKNLITASELDAERNAIEHVLRTGLLPSQDMAGKNAGGKMAAAAKPKASTAAAPAEAALTEITGPVLHLASFRSEESAKKAWQDALGANKAALSSLKPVIKRVDLGPEKGIFYRLMTGPFNSLPDAEAVCIQLKQNNQFCRASADGS